MARKRATLTDLLNDLTARTIYDKYRLLAQSSFVWDGLPDEIQSKYIERLLFKFGKAAFVKDPEMAHMVLECHGAKGFNVYNEPKYFNCVGMGYQHTFKRDEIVVIDNNPLRVATEDIVMMYVGKLIEAERTIDVNVKTNKTPFIITCDERQLLSIKRFLQMVDGNAHAIIADKAINLDNISVLQTGVKFLANELQDYKKSVENELLTLLGYNNLAVDKAERVNIVEATSNNEVTRAFADLQLESRQHAAKQINELFGLSVTVKRRESGNRVDVPNVQHNESNA